MKPTPIKIYLVQILLIVLATSFAFLAIGVPEYDVAFWSASWGNITHGQAALPLILGVIPFTNLSLFFCFLFLYLLFEFYGLKLSVYTALAIALVLLLQFYLSFALQKLNPTSLDNQVLLATVPLSNLKQNTIHALSASVVFGFGSIFMLAWSLKKMTKNYFMFFRFCIASALGFCVFVFINQYLQHQNHLALISIVMASITPSLQFAILSVFAIVPLYLLRLVLGLFRGRGISNDASFASSKPMFKTEAPIAVEKEKTVPEDLVEEVTNDSNPT